ncbi:indole-diterpene biosynthesis protein PaxU [Cordyceps javanica]|uniref:Indole-diterpene biosynthesis protein PaxU n=1 Tax=Cordyceps javanica TaxID=43265 RepID=A0A545VET8_9HYPO|nr:indole-diterpene biosynthesis protein PaxU [Cordyceps javanica]TQW11352.1 indole-diterpene biosynthesis protein PaxU [Cordyceps javanica]
MSNGNVDGAMPANPLGFMKRLSPTVTYYEPTTSTISSGSGDARASPELILLSTWMGARENHIAKYVQEYRVIFPTSRILVAQCPFTHVVMPFLAWTQIRPAVPILKEVVESESTQRLKNDDASVLTGDPTTPRVLIHAFSNGGISTTLFLYNALKRSLGGQFALPQHVFIFDSCPGTFKWRNTARAIMKILPRWSSPAVHAVLFSIWLFYRVVPVLQPRQNVNSRTIRNPRFQEFEVRRTYLYGTDDQMIPPTDVEHEAGLAAEAGFNVRLERFEDATHVAIPMLHPERYWRVVKESWYGEEPATSVVIQGSDGSHASVAAEISSETVTKEISLVDHEKTISEEASILAEDIKNDGKESVKFAEKKAQEASISAQSVVRAASAKTENIRTQSRDIAEKAQSRAEDVKANADSAIEQGKATMKQFTANAAGFVKEVQIKANGQSENEASASAVEDLEAGATRTIIEAKQRTKDAGKDAIAALHGVETKLNEATETKSQPIERPETPDTSTALQAALAAAAASSSPEATKNSSSLKTAGHQSSSGSSGGNGSGVQELAARFGGKVDKSTIKLPKAKASQAELAKMEEPVIVAKPVEQQPVEQKQVTPKSEVENKVPADQPKTGHPKPAGSTKSKKSKKNGKK